MITYFRMKINEWKLKSAIYSSILGFMNSKKTIFETLKNFLESVKDMTGEELRDEFIGKLAEIIHEKSIKDNAKGMGEDIDNLEI